MSDPRFDQLARQLCRFSTRLQRGERVLIDSFDLPAEMTVALVRAVREAGAFPFVQIHQGVVTRELLRGADESQYELLSQLELARMQQMDAYIAFRASHNITELADVPNDRMSLAMKKMRPVIDHRVKKTKWVVLRWPTASMAQQAGMSTEAFEDFYFRVCLLDYEKMIPGMAALKARLDRTDLVEIRGPGTDLRFSVKNIGTVTCGGDRNIPDGEVFTCPVQDSVQGHVTFNAPTIYQGTSFDGVRLEFTDGKVTKATGNPEGQTQRNPRFRRGGAVHRGVFHRVQPARFTTDAGHSVRREDQRAASTSRPARPTRKPTTATGARCTGTWSASSVPNGAAARSFSTARSCGATGCSSCPSCKGSIPTRCSERQAVGAVKALRPSNRAARQLHAPARRTHRLQVPQLAPAGRGA